MRGAVCLVGIGLYYDCLFEILGSPFLDFGHGQFVGYLEYACLG